MARFTMDAGTWVRINGFQDIRRRQQPDPGRLRASYFGCGAEEVPRGSYSPLCPPSPGGGELPGRSRRGTPRLHGHPKSQWKALRTTNAIEPLNGEFRRRIKSRGASPSQEGLLSLLWAPVESGIVRLRHLDGWRDLPVVAAGPAPALRMAV